MEPLSKEMEAVIERATKAGVSEMINVGASMRGSRKSVEIANSYPNIWASVGLHPHDAETILDMESTIDELRTLAKSDKVVAIGEIGLDYFNDQIPITNDQMEKQKELFRKQLELAIEIKKPVILHIRDAWDDALSIISHSSLVIRHSGGTPGAVHCFTGGPEEAKKLLDLGFYIGFTGFITFEQSKFDSIRESVTVVPLDKILIETDAPFLAPEPHRGKTNEPAYVCEVANKIAEIKNVSVEEVAEKTLENTMQLFSI
jgi:TatD DNase family protein